ncbi:hypothetical protein AB0L53_54770 [Nonomuraea sp. NPDC052129]|uniref:hypothetical protein n=1 Tax=Nonomuraea sp. NPDC052129 TaxID=3154651 RepID=UPI00342313C3
MRHLETLRFRVGRRGAALLFFALLDVIYAASLLSAPTSGPYRFLAAILPLAAWASLWAAVGILCAVQAFLPSDRAAFAAAMLIKVVWGMVQLAGWLIGDLDRGYVSAAVWLALAAFVHVISGWPEPARRGR